MRPTRPTARPLLVVAELARPTRPTARPLLAVATLALALTLALPLALTLAASIPTTAHAGDRPLARRDEGTRTFAEAVATRPPIFALELAAGLAYEGTVAADLAWLVPWVPGLELHGAVGIEYAPALRLALSLRYVAPLGDFRPYVALGVVDADFFETGSRSSQLALELGHRFTLGQHTFLSIGAGARVVLDAWLDDGSPLLDGSVDPAAIDAVLANVGGTFAPVVTVRVSRTF